jgi:type IV secretion system protein TrbC
MTMRVDGKTPNGRAPNGKPRIYGKTQNRISAFMALLVYGLVSVPAYAAGSNMPWEGPLQNILDSIQGPVARIFAVIIITGLTLAFGDAGGGFRKLLQVVFGLSVAFAATSFFLQFFGFAGGAVV